MDDHAREAAIHQASQDSMAAHKAGDMEAARQHLDRMTELVKGRSPEQVAAMEREYFGWRGEQDRSQMLERAIS